MDNQKFNADILAREYVRPRLQPRRPLRHAGQILELGQEITVIQEEPFDGAREDLEFLAGLERRQFPTTIPRLASTAAQSSPSTTKERSAL